MGKRLFVWHSGQPFAILAKDKDMFNMVETYMTAKPTSHCLSTTAIHTLYWNVTLISKKWPVSRTSSVVSEKVFHRMGRDPMHPHSWQSQCQYISHSDWLMIVSGWSRRRMSACLASFPYDVIPSYLGRAESDAVAATKPCRSGIISLSKTTPGYKGLQVALGSLLGRVK